MKKLLLMIVLACIALTGCTSVVVEKEDGTKVAVTTWGSSKLDRMSYNRKGNAILLMIGQAANNPAGMPEVIESTGGAIGQAAKTFIKP